jgi:hypothetical protein
VGVAEDCTRDAVPAGDDERTGGVPCFGGDPPSEEDKAAASADLPGPGTLWPAPGRGLSLAGDGASAMLGEDGRTGGVLLIEGIGEARRAVASARGVELRPRPRKDAGEDES